MTAFLCTVLEAPADQDLVAIANALWWRGEYEVAVEMYEAASGDSDTNIELEARLQLAALYRSMSRYDEAIKQYEILRSTRGLSDGRNPVFTANNLFVPLGESYYYTGRFDEAEEAFRRALDLEPTGG
jgi:tetratricopeptide (TPR) repeat protein